MELIDAVFKRCTKTKQFNQWYSRLNKSERDILRCNVRQRRNRIERNKNHLKALRVISWKCNYCKNINRQQMEGNVMGIAPSVCRLCGESQLNSYNQNKLRSES